MKTPFPAMMTMITSHEAEATKVSVSTASRPSRRGIELKPAAVRKRHNIAFRVNDALRAKLQKDADASQRSVSEQIEYKLQLADDLSAILDAVKQGRIAMSFLDLEQGSEAWFKARLGKVTASRVADVMATIRSGGYGASRSQYMAELLIERLIGRPLEAYINAAMQYGLDTEPEARLAYEFAANVDVVEVGFVPHPSIPMSGASPDGLVGDDGLIEIKCPTPATHIETLLAEKIPQRYVSQMQWQLACTGRQWVDYVSYDNRLPEAMRLFISRLQRDDRAIEALQREVGFFLNELNNKEEALRRRYGNDSINQAAYRSRPGIASGTGGGASAPPSSSQSATGATDQEPDDREPESQT